MDRKLHSITGRAGGVTVTVSADARRRLRRISRAAGIAIGACSGITAVIMAAQVIAENERWPWILALAAVGAWTVVRGKAGGRK